MPFPVSAVSMMASTSAMAFYVVVLLRLGAVEVKGSTSALPMARSGGEGQHVGVDGDNMPQGFPVWWR